MAMRILGTNMMAIVPVAMRYDATQVSEAVYEGSVLLTRMIGMSTAEHRAMLYTLI